LSLDDYDLSENDRLHNELRMHKEQIGTFHRSNRWDGAKRLTNEYELVYTVHTKFAKHDPVSRSFFKLWEILHDFEGLIPPDRPVTSLFLAEGPGGFVEAFAKFRQQVMGDVSYAITLASDNPNVPRWKIPTRSMAGLDLRLVNGADRTGNICDIKNADSLIAEVGLADFVTGDGGFDYSSNFSMQEQTSLMLLISEVYVAVSVQKRGGSFVLKVFDVSTKTCVQLLSILDRSYSEVSICKPLTSRPANSEKYVVCQQFLGVRDVDSSALRKCIVQRSAEPLTQPSYLSQSMCSQEFLDELMQINQCLIQKQIGNIQTTVDMLTATPEERQELSKICAKQQPVLASLWCEQYKC
jgi:23S rRNA U2552 (ribose-2'-O)-methylase RlmE/FtsJ